MDMTYIVTYYLDLRNAISVYCKSHLLPTKVELVVWALQKINIFDW